MSRVSSPAKTTPCSAYRSDSRCRPGISARQGGHHEAHTLSTTVLPCWSASDQVPPSRVGPDSSGASSRSAAGTTVTRPSPATYPWSLPPPELTGSPAVSAEHPLSSATPASAAAASVAARRVGEGVRMGIESSTVGGSLGFQAPAENFGTPPTSTGSSALAGSV